MDSSTERYRLLQGVLSWLEGLAETAPVLVVLDDLHWATQPTVLMLRHVLRIPDLPLMVVGTFRALPAGHPLGSVAGSRDPDMTDIWLTGLAPADVAEIVVTANPRLGGDRKVVAAIAERSDGNPFFLGEILRQIGGSSGVTVEDVLSLGSTSGMEQMVGRRLSRLGETTNAVLAAAAVVGSDVDVKLLAEVSGLSDAVVLDSIDEATAAGLTEEVGPDSLRFTHDLVRESVVSSLSATRRVRLHRRVAEGLEVVHAARVDEVACDIAHHRLASASSGEEEALLPWLRRAGDCAAETAPEEAVRWYGEHVTRHTERDVERVDVLIALGEAQRRAGIDAFRGSLLEAAVLACGLGLPDRLARAALTTNRGFASRAFAVDEEITAVLHRALDSIGPEDSRLRAELMVTLATELVFSDDVVERDALAHEAVAMARRLEDPETLANVLLRYGHVKWYPGTAAERLDVAFEIEGLRSRAQSGGAQPGCELAFYAALELGRRDEADAWMQKWDALIDEGCGLDAYTRFLSLVGRSSMAIFDAEYGAAEDLLVEAQAVGESGGDPDWERYLLALRFHLWLDRGELGEHREVLEEQAAGAPDDDIAVATLARMYVETGERDAARVAFERWLAARSYLERPLNIVWPLHVMTAVDLVCELGLTEHAGPLHDRLSGLAGMYPVLPPALWLGSVDHALGRLARLHGDAESAVRHLESSLDLHDRLRGPVWMVRSRIELAAVVGDRDPERAGRLRQEAADLVTRHGLSDTWLCGQVLVPASVGEQDRLRPKS